MELNTKDELVKVIKNLQEEIENTKSELTETRQIVDTYNSNSNEENQENEGSENEDSENDFSDDELDEVSKLLLEE